MIKKGSRATIETGTQSVKLGSSVIIDDEIEKTQKLKRV